MPVQIGAPVHNFSDPTGFLGDCHRRIEMFLGALVAAAAAADRPLATEMRAALESALRYFRESAPKHNADEEESLFPRLRASGAREAEAVLAAVRDLEKEHRWAAPRHAEVERLGRRWLSAGRLTEAEAAEFRKAVSELEAMYREHIRIEDEVVFPVASRLLSPQDRAAIGKEMAGRRGR